jgi:hypothetical protein
MGMRRDLRVDVSGAAATGEQLTVGRYRPAARRRGRPTE